MTFEELLKKKIVIIGLGQEGMSILNFLHAKGATNLTVADAREVQDLPQAEQAIKLGANLRTGPGYLRGLEDFDVIFRSPGVAGTLPEIRIAVKKGAVLHSLTKLFFELCPAEMVGITGTKGKGTTVTLITQMLTQGLPKRKIFLAGNIGIPMLDLLPQMSAHDIVVLELSSYQLEDLESSPEIAVLLNIVPEHLAHHGTFRNYVAAKTNLIKFQKPGDLLITNFDYPLLVRLSRLSKAKKLWVSRKSKPYHGPACYIQGDQIVFMAEDGKEQVIMTLGEVKLLGEHNLENILPSIAVAMTLGVDPTIAKKVISTFEGLPHRLQLVKEVGNVKFYDDSIATIPEATVAALKTFEGPLALILGGSSKVTRFEKLAQEINKRPNTYAVLIGKSASTIAQALEKYARKTSYKFARNMDEAVSKSYEFVRPTGGIVSLSPADASFDMYVNFQARGEDFQKWVKELGG